MTVSEIKPTFPPIEDGGAFYVPVEQVHPGQLRYSRQNVSEKVVKLREKLGLSAPTGFTRPPLKDSVPVIEAPFGYVLVDGHHDVLAALNLGATEIPVRVIRRWKSLPPELFWDKAEKEGLVYLKNSDGIRAVPPENFKDLVEDPNRYFAAISARKFPLGEEKSTGAEYPLWIKRGKGVPFVEFRISDTMSRHRLLYTKDLENEDPKAYDQLVEKVRGVLLEDPIEGLEFVPRRAHYSESGSL